MREMILKAVAQPPKILWGPFLPVILNMGCQFPFMFIYIGIFDGNPLLFMATIITGHAAIISLGAKEPHISNMITAFGQSRKVSTNLYKEKGDKFEP